MENTDTIKTELVNSDESSTIFGLEISEAGDPIPFKITKLEHDTEDDSTIIQMAAPIPPAYLAGTLANQAIAGTSAGPSNIDHFGLAGSVYNSSSTLPNFTGTGTKQSLRTENYESMELMSSDDEFSVDSDVEIYKNSDNESEYEYVSDSDDPVSAGNQGKGIKRKLDGANAVNDCGNLGLRHTSQVQNPDPLPKWLSDETSMKQFEFTKKRELLVPAPLTPYDAFRWFLDDELLDAIVRATNTYATLVSCKESIAPQSRFRSWRDVSREEMITFLALLIHTGTIRMNRLSDYWKGEYLFNLNCFSRFMKRNRFMVILNSLNVAVPDPNSRKTDHFAKIRPMINHFNEKMNEIYYPGKELTIAKSMVFWNGRLVRQEYTDHRRIKNALSMHMLADFNGTVVKYQVYAGNTNDNIYKASTGEIVLELLADKLGNGHSVYMDKYYSSYNLATELLKCRTYCTGTLHKKATDNPFRQDPYNKCRLTNKSVFSNGVHVGKWKDKKSSLYITTEFKNQLYQVLDRGGTFRNEPRALISYKKHMTSNELQDRLMSYQPCTRKSMRWYKKLFIHSLQIYMSNAYHMYNNFSCRPKKMSYYDFRLFVLREMLPEPPVAAPKSLQTLHVLTKITRTRPREKRDRDGTTRIIYEMKRKECKSCRLNKRRTATMFECEACEGCPGYCPKCFCDVHSA